MPLFIERSADTYCRAFLMMLPLMFSPRDAMLRCWRFDYATIFLPLIRLHTLTPMP